MTRAIGLFGHDWDPNYYVNPPAYTYLVHLVLGLWYGGRAGVSNSFAADPTEIWIIARTIAALLGTLAVWLLYLAGTRLVDRRVGLLSAGIFAVAFLPVFYSKLALNDVPTLAGVCLALWGAAGMLRHGRMRDYVLAGLGLGLACATKYTGGIVLLPIVAAAGAQFGASGGRASALRGLLIVAVASLASFFGANPYAVLDFSSFWEGLTHQSDGLRRRRRQARAHAGLRLRLLPVVLRLGPGVDRAAVRRRRRGAAVRRRAPAVLDARAADHRVRPVHGLAGALLRALAHAGLPVRLRAGRLRRGRARRLAGPAGAGVAPDGRRRGGRPALRAGLRLLAALGPRPVARGHARHRPRLDGGQRAGGQEDRRRAGRARPVGAGRRQALARRRRSATAGTSIRSAARSTRRRASRCRARPAS